MLTAWELLLVAASLCMDTLALAVSCGLTVRERDFRLATRVGLCFGIPQASAPLLGYLAGFLLVGFIQQFDHWLAFGLLAMLGIKMIVEARRDGGGECKEGRLSTRVLLVMGVATSIDALVVGVTFAFLEVNMVLAFLVILGVTFLTGFAGVLVGHRVGRLFKQRAEIAGGICLILLGTKILLEHLLVAG